MSPKQCLAPLFALGIGAAESTGWWFDSEPLELDPVMPRHRLALERSLDGFSELPDDVASDLVGDYTVEQLVSAPAVVREQGDLSICRTVMVGVRMPGPP